MYARNAGFLRPLATICANSMGGWADGLMGGDSGTSAGGVTVRSEHAARSSSAAMQLRFNMCPPGHWGGPLWRRARANRRPFLASGPENTRDSPAHARDSSSISRRAGLDLLAAAGRL